MSWTENSTEDYDDDLQNHQDLHQMGPSEDSETLQFKINFYRIAIPIMLVFGFISIVINLIIVASTQWIRRSLSPTLCFSISLAGADAFTSLVLSVTLLFNSLLPVGYNIYIGIYYGCIAFILESFRMGAMLASVLHLLALAVNHYIGILRPLHYASTMTRRNAMFGITVMWVLPMLFFIVYFSSIENMGFRSYYCNDFRFLTERTFRNVIGAIFFTPLVLMAATYAHIFVIVRQHHAGIIQYQNTTQLNKNVKAVITTLLILGTYLIGWMPAVLFFLLTCTDCVHPLENIPGNVLFALSFTFNTLILLKSLVDPIIYAARMKEIRGALQRMKRSCCCSTSTRNRRGTCLRSTGNKGKRNQGEDTISSVRSRTETTASLRLQSTYSHKERSSSFITSQSKKLVSENGC